MNTREHTHWPHTSTPSSEKKRHFAVAGAWQIYDWMGAGGWMRPRDSQRQPGSPQGVCVHAKPNRDCAHPLSTQQVVRLPGSPGPVVLNCPWHHPPPVLLQRHHTDGILAAGCFTMFWCLLPATCRVLAPALS